MVEIIWSEPALADLDASADYIALDNRAAAVELVRRVFAHVDHLADHPDSGSRPPELKRGRYRQIVEPPCRVFYRSEPGACSSCMSCAVSDCSGPACCKHAGPSSHAESPQAPQAASLSASWDTHSRKSCGRPRISCVLPGARLKSSSGVRAQVAGFSPAAGAGQRSV